MTGVQTCALPISYEDLPDDQKHLPGESSWGKSDDPSDDDAEEITDAPEDIDDDDDDDNDDLKSSYDEDSDVIYDGSEELSL